MNHPAFLVQGVDGCVRWVAVGLAILVAGCMEQSPEDEVFTLLRVIDSDTAGPGHPFEAFDTFSMNLADLAGDGRLQLVSLNDNMHTYVIDPVRGEILAELATTHPANGTKPWGARDVNGVAIGNVAGDGRPELVVLNSASVLTMFQMEGDFQYRKAWERNAHAAKVDPDFHAKHPWINATQDQIGADGNAFIAHTPQGPVLLAQSDGIPGHFGYSASGELLWHTTFWDGNAGAWAGPLRQGGPVMAVFATDSGEVVAYDAAKGQIQWTFKAADNGAVPGSIPVMVNVYDLDGDGRKEILIGPRVAVDDGSTDWMQDSHAIYFLLDADGRILWRVQPEWGNPLLYMHPAAVDVTLDGTKDLLVVDWNTIGHNPGNWEKVGPAQAFALDGENGRPLWNRKVDSAWSNKGVLVGKFIPDEDPVMVVEEQVGERDGFAFLDMKGRRRGWMGLPDEGWKVTRGPVAGDLDADGLVEFIVPVSIGSTGCPRALDVGCRQGALLVYGTSARVADVQFANNFLFDSEDRGTVPVATVKPGDVPRAKTDLGPHGMGLPAGGIAAVLAGLAFALALRRPLP